MSGLTVNATSSETARVRKVSDAIFFGMTCGAISAASAESYTKNKITQMIKDTTGKMDKFVKTIDKSFKHSSLKNYASGAAMGIALGLLYYLWSSSSKGNKKEG